MLLFGWKIRALTKENVPWQKKKRPQRQTKSTSTEKNSFTPEGSRNRRKSPQRVYHRKKGSTTAIGGQQNVFKTTGRGERARSRRQGVPERKRRFILERCREGEESDAKGAARTYLARKREGASLRKTDRTGRGIKILGQNQSFCWGKTTGWKG